jgi:phosphonate transport system substrate-binding protein
MVVRRSRAPTERATPAQRVIAVMAVIAAQLAIGALVAMGALVAGCGRRPQGSTEPVYATAPPPGVTEPYVIGVHPLHNPRRLDAVFGPLVEHLSRVTGRPFRLEASRSYEAFEEKLRRRTLAFALPNPYETVRCTAAGYHVLAKLGDDAGFHGILLVRGDAGIETVADLRGKKIAFPAPTALAATMLPQMFLHEHGLEIGRDYQAVYVGSQDSSIMSVYRGEVTAAATWPPPWQSLSKERPELARALVVRWTTDSLPNNGFVVRDDVPLDVARAVQAELIRPHADASGRYLPAETELGRFVAADATTYAPVRAFLQRFAERVRQLP